MPLASAMTSRSVLLLHRAPDGGEHFDWLFERPSLSRAVAGACGTAGGAKGGEADDQVGDDGRCLRSFRVDVRVDELSAADAGAMFDARAMPDHRRVYLRFEGELSGGRGRVRRVAAWMIRVLEDEPTLLVVRQGDVTLSGRPLDDGAAGVWVFKVLPALDQ